MIQKLIVMETNIGIKSNIPSRLQLKIFEIIDKQIQDGLHI
jgi:hypothetical protein